MEEKITLKEKQVVNGTKKALLKESLRLDEDRNDKIVLKDTQELDTEKMEPMMLHVEEEQHEELASIKKPEEKKGEDGEQTADTVQTSITVLKNQEMGSLEKSEPMVKISQIENRDEKLTSILKIAQEKKPDVIRSAIDPSQTNKDRKHTNHDGKIRKKVAHKDGVRISDSKTKRTKKFKTKVRIAGAKVSNLDSANKEDLQKNLIKKQLKTPHQDASLPMKVQHDCKQISVANPDIVSNVGMITKVDPQKLLITNTITTPTLLKKKILKHKIRKDGGNVISKAIANTASSSVGSLTHVDPQKLLIKKKLSTQIPNNNNPLQVKIRKDGNVTSKSIANNETSNVGRIKNVDPQKIRMKKKHILNKDRSLKITIGCKESNNNILVTNSGLIKNKISQNHTTKEQLKTPIIHKDKSLQIEKNEKELKITSKSITNTVSPALGSIQMLKSQKQLTIPGLLKKKSFIAENKNEFKKIFTNIPNTVVPIVSTIINPVSQKEVPKKITRIVFEDKPKLIVKEIVSKSADVVKLEPKNEVELNAKSNSKKIIKRISFKESPLKTKKIIKRIVFNEGDGQPKSGNAATPAIEKCSYYLEPRPKEMNKKVETYVRDKRDIRDRLEIPAVKGDTVFSRLGSNDQRITAKPDDGDTDDMDTADTTEEQQRSRSYKHTKNVNNRSSSSHQRYRHADTDQQCQDDDATPTTLQYRRGTAASAKQYFHDNVAQQEYDFDQEYRRANPTSKQYHREVVAKPVRNQAIAKPVRNQAIAKPVSKEVVAQQECDFDQQYRRANPTAQQYHREVVAKPVRNEVTAKPVRNEEDYKFYLHDDSDSDQQDQDDGLAAVEQYYINKEASSRRRDDNVDNARVDYYFPQDYDSDEGKVEVFTLDERPSRSRQNEPPKRAYSQSARIKYPQEASQSVRKEYPQASSKSVRKEYRKRAASQSSEEDDYPLESSLPPRKKYIRRIAHMDRPRESDDTQHHQMITEQRSSSSNHHQYRHGNDRSRMRNRESSSEEEEEDEGQQIAELQQHRQRTARNTAPAPGQSHYRRPPSELYPPTVDDDRDERSS